MSEYQYYGDLRGDPIKVLEKKARAYEETIGIRKNLSSLAAHRKDSQGFHARFHELYEPYRKLSELRWRLKEAG